MTAAVREALNGLIGKVCAEGGVDRNDILDIVFVGNPIMHHLFLGIDPIELGGAPFALAVSGACNTWARDLGLAAQPGACVYVLPCIAGHVGADTAGVDAVGGAAPPGRDHAARRCRHQCRDRAGQRAAPRRLLLADRPGLRGRADLLRPARRARRHRAHPHRSRRRWSRATGSSARNCGRTSRASTKPSQATGVTGICGSGIIEVIAEMYLAGIISQDGVVDGALAARSAAHHRRTAAPSPMCCREGEPRITVTQNDVRAIQLAKAALYAGIRLLMEKHGIDACRPHPLRRRLRHLHRSEIRHGAGPDPGLRPRQGQAAGNAAGTGAASRCSTAATAARSRTTVSRIEKIETALEPKFQEHFVDAMALPNKVDPFPKLSAAVKLPPRKTVSEEGVAGDAAPRRRSARATLQGAPGTRRLELAGFPERLEGRADMVGGRLAPVRRRPAHNMPRL